MNTLTHFQTNELYDLPIRSEGQVLMMLYSQYDSCATIFEKKILQVGVLHLEGSGQSLRLEYFTIKKPYHWLTYIVGLWEISREHDEL